MRYVIKNCGCNPACDECYIRCKDITDCLLKRIAELCKAEKDKGFIMSRYGCKVPVSQGYDLACRILKEMKIEVSENER